MAGHVDAGEQDKRSGLVIDAHCHAGTGEAMSAPWTTFADPEVTLRRAAEAGIDKTVIFPIENPTYERANEEIARLVEKHPGKFIGFAKHDPQAEAGKIERLLTREVRQLGLKGLKLHKTPTRETLDVVASPGHPDPVPPAEGRRLSHDRRRLPEGSLYHGAPGQLRLEGLVGAPGGDRPGGQGGLHGPRIYVRAGRQGRGDGVEGRFAWTDTYGVDIAEGEDDILILASTVVIDMACHEQKDRA